MRDHSHHIELTRDEAVRQMVASLSEYNFNAKCRSRLDHVEITNAYGRILAEDVLAKTDIPNALTCCLDSVALRWSDFEGLNAGEIPDTTNWTRGDLWEFANTGIAMPAGFDTAVVIEHVEVSEDGEHIKLLAAPSEKHAGTKAAGSSAHAGDVAVKSGTVITPDIAAQIASSGHSSVVVEAKPSVVFLPTGNELVPANLPYSATSPDAYAGYGRVFESNGVLTRGKVEAWGGNYSQFDIVPDDYESIKNAIKSAVATSDIVVLNAGSSKGSDDWSVEVLEEIGTIVCHQVAHGPGHHSFYAIVDDTPIVGISGPPGGVSFTLGFYLLPIIKLWSGLDPYPIRFDAVLAGSFGENKYAAKDSDASKSLAGEKRPPEATSPDSPFQSVRFMDVTVDANGVVRATPRAGKAGSAKTQSANAIYMLASGVHATYPIEGDIIQVEMRL